MNILVIGHGAREHAIVWKCRQSKLTDRIYCAPGNPGIAEIARCVDIKESNFLELAAFAREKHIDFTIVGPEAPLVDGIVDVFESNDLKIFGPNKYGAILEGSKMYAKRFMSAYGIPTADYTVFAGLEYAKHCLGQRNADEPCVVKADGIAAGKGVTVAKNTEEAIRAVDRIAEQNLGNIVIVEDVLEGWECSYIVFTDGNSFVPLPAACDYKRFLDEDEGPNTGGMGAYAPVPKLTQSLENEIRRTIVAPTLAGMRQEKICYRGILYFGLMITDSGPMLLEYNCRLGDPEAQVILPLLKEDFVELCLATLRGGLHKYADTSASAYNIHTDTYVAVILASPGYPGVPDIGLKIYGLKQAEKHGGLIFHAATKIDKDGSLVTAGGRVLTVAGRGQSHIHAREQAYRAARCISFEGGREQYRYDIAAYV